MQRAGNLAEYKTGKANNPKEDGEEEKAVENRKQPARNPVGGSHGWGNENEPTSAPSTLGITGGAAGRLTKQGTTLPAEGNSPRAGTTAHEIHRVLMGGNLMPQNKVGGRNGMGGGTGKTEEPTAGQQKGAGRGSMGWSALTEAVQMFGPAETTQDFFKKLLKWQAYVGGSQKSAPRLKYKRRKRRICG